MNYAALLDKLFQVNLYSGIKLGLDNSLELQKILGYPDRKFQSIHVAGTNGKGSVTAMVAKGLELQGFRVGLYTSPHISSFRERICVNGEMISEQSIEKLLPPLFQLIDQHQIPATFFEITTFLAFLYFAQEDVDIVVLETGLGGRLDATNIVNPLISVITSISQDHTQQLGNSLEEIAYEKGGIIKPGVPVILGPRVPLSLMQEIANSKKSMLKQVVGNHSNFMDENASIARATLMELNVSTEAIKEGLKARQPCRLEIVQDRVILDVAHNPDGLSHLFSAIQQLYGSLRIRLVLGLSKNKDIKMCLRIIKDKGHEFHLVEAPNGRGLSTNELHQALLDLNVKAERLHSHETIKAAIKDALHLSHHNGEVLAICGTFFIMSEARKALGISEPCDSYDTNEGATIVK